MKIFFIKRTYIPLIHFFTTIPYQHLTEKSQDLTLQSKQRIDFRKFIYWINNNMSIHRRLFLDQEESQQGISLKL